MLKKITNLFKRKKIEKEKTILSLKKEVNPEISKFKLDLKFAYGINSISSEKINTLSEIYDHLKKSKSTIYFNLITNIQKNNPDVSHSIFLKLKDALETVNNGDVKYFLKNYAELVDLSKKNNFNNFDSSYKKLVFVYNSFNLEKSQEVKFKVIEYLKYLIRFEKIENISIKQIEKEIDRIRAGLLQTKITSSKNKGTCIETYNGFLTSLRYGNVYFIKVNNKDYLIKTPIGITNNEGPNKLALDLETLNVHSFKTVNGKNVISKEPLEYFYNYKHTFNVALSNYFEKLKTNYIKYYENKVFKNEKQREQVIKRISQIFDSGKYKLNIK